MNPSMNPSAVPLQRLNEADCWDVKADVPRRYSLRWRIGSQHAGHETEIIHLPAEVRE